MKNEAILRGMLGRDEKFFWQVTGSISDWKYNPIFLILTVCTLGLFLIPLTLVRHYNYYVLTSTRLIIIKGILTRTVDEIELFRIVDSKSFQGPIDRIANLGKITVSSTDKTGVAVMRKIPYPHDVRDSLRQAYYEARKEQGTVLLESIVR